MRGGHARGALAALLIFAVACLVALLVGPGRDRPPPVMDASPQARVVSVDLEADAAMPPLEGADGAAGVVARANAGGAVNPITPTGDAGGPAGQTPAYGQPGGAPSRVVRP